MRPILILALAACGDGGSERSGDGGLCPSVQPASGDPCASNGLSCRYGSETCCGETFDSYVCQCMNGSYSCYYTDACLVPACVDGGVDAPPDGATMTDGSSCPATQPEPGAACSPGSHCEYGSETCCGETYPSIVCDCYGAGFGCYYTDACLIPSCPDAGSDAP